MSRFVALQAKVGESDHDVVGRFFSVASGMGLRFEYLEPYGSITIGSTKLLRFRTDCPEVERLISFFQDEQRAYVIPGGTGYRYITQTTEGQAPIMAMQESRTGYKRKYRGTSDRFWTRQFA